MGRSSRSRFKPSMTNCSPRGYRKSCLPYPIVEKQEGRINSLTYMKSQFEDRIKDDPLYIRLARVIQKEIER